jgi:amino acid permease
MPLSHILFFKKNPKRKKKKDSLYKYVMGPWGHISFWFFVFCLFVIVVVVFLNKICNGGILGKKSQNGRIATI